MKIIRFVFCTFLVAAVSAVALARPLQAGQQAPPPTKTSDLPTQGQALVDGMLAYDNSSGKLTLEGPAARVLFLKMSDERITSKEPTDECQPVVIKSGDHLECGHCEVHGKRKNDFNYWCVLNLDTEFGKVLPNTTISAPVPTPTPAPLPASPKSK